MTFRNCLLLGIYSNLFFIAFILFCLMYYDLYRDSGEAVREFEIIAMSLEAIGFFIMTMSIFMMIVLVQGRLLLKISMAAYLLIEVTVMALDFTLLEWEWYDGYAPWLIIAHAIVSAFVCMTYLTLDKRNKHLQISVGVSAAVMLAGMLAIAFGQRIYISVLTNTFAYMILYNAMIVLMRYDILIVDCYGYKAEVKEYRSSFFE